MSRALPTFGLPRSGVARPPRGVHGRRLYGGGSRGHLQQRVSPTSSTSSKPRTWTPGRRRRRQAGRDGHRRGTGETDAGDTETDSDSAGAEETDTGTTDPGDPIPCDVGAACGDDLVLDIGTMSGDQGSDMLMATGTTEAWVEFSSPEDDLSALNGANMSFIAQLASPPGVDFDLEGRRSNAPTSDPCAGTVTQTSQNPVGIDQIAMYWGEAASPNGEDDTRRVIMHVIPPQDTCQTGLSWTLTVVRG